MIAVMLLTDSKSNIEFFKDECFGSAIDLFEKLCQEEIDDEVFIDDRDIGKYRAIAFGYVDKGDTIERVNIVLKQIDTTIDKYLICYAVKENTNGLQMPYKFFSSLDDAIAYHKSHACRIISTYDCYTNQIIKPI